MKRTTAFVLILLSVILVVGIPIAIDWLIIGNSVPSNISNSAWVGFLGSYLGAIIGGAVSLTGIILTIRFTRLQLNAEKEQYAEQKRLNNLPALDCQISDVGGEETDDCIDLNLDSLSSEMIVALEITNIGIGVASNLRYGVLSNSYGDDGAFWLWKNRVVLSQNQITQKLKFGIPEDKEHKIKLFLYYEDVLENTYKKQVTIHIENGLVLILDQHKGELVSNFKRPQNFVVFNKNGKNEVTAP